MTGGHVEGRIERTKQRDGCREHRGLCIRGQLQVFFGTLETEPRERFTERSVGFFEHRARGVRRFVRIETHADFLAALTRENKCDLAHRVAA